MMNLDAYLESLKKRRPSTEPAAGYVEVKDEPQHYHRFENDYARVYDVRFKPGERSLYHRHSRDTLYVTVYDTTVFDHTFKADSGQTHQLPAGLCGCRPHGTDPLIHQIRNDGQGLMHMIGAEHKKTPPVVADKLLDAPFHEPIEDPFKGEAIRFYRITLKPGEKTGPVEYNFSGLLVSISDASIKMAGGEVLSFCPGSHIWHDGPLTRQMHNVGETDFVAYLGEWR